MKRRKFLIGLGSAGIGGSALIGSSAFSRVEAHRSMTIQTAEDPNAYLGMDKCGGDDPTPNGSYAHLDDLGHLKIFMDDENPTIGESPLGEGVNSDSTSEFDRVFQICNQGKQAVCVWIQDDDAWPRVPDGEKDAGERRVDFYYEDAIGRSIVGEDNKLTLKVGECACVGIVTRTYGLQEGDAPLADLDDEITITATVECFEDPGCVEVEEIFLTNSSPTDSDGNEIDGTEILTVDSFDNSAGEAVLTSEQVITDPNFNQVDSLACTPDGQTLYFYDKTTGRLGTLDTDNLGASIDDLGQVNNPSGSDPDEVVLGAFSPDGTLYVVGQRDDDLWEVDPTVSPPQATKVGSTGIDTSGSDIVFDGDTGYLHTNADSPDFYELNTSDGSATARCEIGDALTGLAIRDGGVGDILGSRPPGPASGSGGPGPGEIIRFDRNTCSVEQRYDMILDGEAYLYESGDMATGTRCVLE